ncbi:IML2 [Candida pseudojiufengensis]|uniref:IML2 n=1 Tax=Candida pseudojiufengensis TaxID=497109 RepID=UPI002224BE67|nr:IML2 [Candida pseudojiufengensis]KAI5961412.1 IML2 [Candida pseudojiufengensis]
MFKGLRKKASILSLYTTTSNQSIDSTNEPNSDQSNYEKVIRQVHDFEIALKAMDYLLDDRTDQGTKLLEEESKTISIDGQPRAVFPLALGVMEFIEATLGFEPEVMAKAHKTLSEAENISINNAKYNVRYQLATSNIYPPGTEFQVTQAESTLLNALLMLLTENNGMVESAKALFKLRKAYQILDAVYKKIKESEPIFNKNLAKLRKKAAATTNGSSLKQGLTMNNNSISTVDLPGYDSQTSSTTSLPQDLKLMKNLEKIFLMRKARIEGTNLGNNTTKKNINLFEDSNSSITLIKQSNNNSPQNHTPKIFINENSNSDDEEFVDALENLTTTTDLSNNDLSQPTIDSSAQSILSSVETSESSPVSDSHLHVSTTDEFIHSGVQLCFGILQVVLSLIPPAIGKVLSIVGFKGDRDIGLKLLWTTAITSRNVHGELALLFLLMFYDGPIQFVDTGFKLPNTTSNNNILSLENKTTVSDSELQKIMDDPPNYTGQLLKRARHHFPHNALWILQEGRMLAAHGDLIKASTIMQNFTDDKNNKIQMQQIEALLVFDRAMIYMYMHEYDKAARDLIYLIEINSWSKAVYLFMAAACYLEKYRMIKMGLVKVDNIEEESKKYSELFSKYMKLSLSYVPGHGSNAQKKGGLGGSGKQMPFDKFLLRKCKHIENRKKQYPNLSYADLVGTSLVHELIYFWNGYNRMTQDNFKIALKLLGYSGAANTELSANTTNHSYAKIEETEDEAMIRYFLQSIILRQLGQVKEGLKILDQHVISKYVISDQPQFRFHKLSYSPYIYPTAFYEKTMFIWLLKTRLSENVDIKSAANESKNWLKKAEIVGEGDYELSNRTSMRIKAAGDRLDLYS